MTLKRRHKGIASDLYLDESLEAQLYFAAVRRQSEPLGELRYHAQIDYDVPVLTVRVHPFVSDFKIGLKTQVHSYQVSAHFSFPAGLDLSPRFSNR
jgi:hypothetical protein